MSAHACIYYTGCDEPRNACGYCDTHCLCGYFSPAATDQPHQEEA